MRFRVIKSRLLLCFMLCVSMIGLGCGSSFSGGGDAGGKGFKGGSGPDRGSQDVVDVGGQGDPQNGGNNGWPTNPNGRQDVPVDYGGDNENLYVSANFVYNGEYSGSDALFTFYMQRATPAPMRQMQEVIWAKGDDVDSTNVVDKFCRCGQRSEYYFYWAHKNGRKGALHAPYYNQDPRLMGDWIVGNNVAGDGGDDWYEGNLETVPQGPHSFFFGADTENPTALLGVNKEGVGYLRTWFYHPNSLDIFSTKDHVWHARDDMRIGFTCNISQCPANLQQNTSVTVRAHFSHSPQWIRP